jgi:hypothetical protein
MLVKLTQGGVSRKVNVNFCIDQFTTILFRAGENVYQCRSCFHGCCVFIAVTWQIAFGNPAKYR